MLYVIQSLLLDVKSLTGKIDLSSLQFLISLTLKAPLIEELALVNYSDNLQDITLDCNNLQKITWNLSNYSSLCSLDLKLGQFDFLRLSFSARPNRTAMTYVNIQDCSNLQQLEILNCEAYACSIMNCPKLTQLTVKNSFKEQPFQLNIRESNEEQLRNYSRIERSPLFLQLFHQICEKKDHDPTRSEQQSVNMYN